MNKKVKERIQALLDEVTTMTELLDTELHQEGLIHGNIRLYIGPEQSMAWCDGITLQAHEEVEGLR